mmetsp:Transcript_5498/g.14498  ORF Transcript_5498/g.14498 Transcript_5498/m.14498 type:complete len:453 (-) Transcript_5498:737-2095(-)
MHLRCARPFFLLTSPISVWLPKPVPAWCARHRPPAAPLMLSCRRRSRSRSQEELKAVLVEYLALLHKCVVVCCGISLTESELGFKWSDAFDTSAFGHVDDWSYERASVLFSLAAAYAFTATHRDRATPDGVKAACNDFQCSAGILEMLQSEMRTAPYKGSADLSVDTLATLKTLMLAQAQKCFYEKARDDGKSASILAKLTADCSALYEEVSFNISQAKGAQRPIAAMSSEWLDVVEWNRLLFDGLQQYFLAKVHLAAFEYGKQIARLDYATAKCAEAVNKCAGAASVLRKQFVDAHAKCAEEQMQAKKDNDLIYNEKVPAFATLPKPERMAHALVKPQTPATLTDPKIAEDPEPLPQPIAPPPAPPSDVQVVTPIPAPEAPPSPPVAQMAAMGVAASADEPPPPSFEQAEALGIDQLVGMGFDRAKAEAALAKAGGSVQAATEALLSGNVP